MCVENFWCVHAIYTLIISKRGRSVFGSASQSRAPYKVRGEDDDCSASQSAVSQRGEGRSVLNLGDLRENDAMHMKLHETRKKAEKLKKRRLTEAEYEFYKRTPGAILSLLRPAPSRLNALSVLRTAHPPYLKAL